MGLRPTQEDEKHADQETVGGMPNCSLLTGRDRRRAADISTRQAWLLMFIAPTSRYARYGAPTVSSLPAVECFSTERSAVERSAVYFPGSHTGSSAPEVRCFSIRQRPPR